MKIERIEINPEYEKLLPKLTGEEYEALKASVASDGLLYPIIVNQKGVILDGHNRFHVCVDLKVDPRFETKNFDDPLEEKRFVIEVNLKRRHLSMFSKAEMVKELEVIEKELAKQRQKTAGKPLSEISEKGNVVDIVGKKIGMSGDTYDNAKKVMNVASEKAKEKLRHDDWSINYAHEGYKALGEMDDKKKSKELKSAFEDDKITAPQLIDLKNKANLAKEMIESRAPKEHKEEITEKFTEKFYTPDLDLRELDLELQKAGGLVDLKELEISKEVIKTKSDAEAYFKKRKGFLEGETCYWKGKVDPTVGDE